MSKPIYLDFDPSSRGWFAPVGSHAIWGNNLYYKYSDANTAWAQISTQVVPLGVETVTGDGVNNTDPHNPTITASGGGGLKGISTGVVDKYLGHERKLIIADQDNCAFVHITQITTYDTFNIMDGIILPDDEVHDGDIITLYNDSGVTINMGFASGDPVYELGGAILNLNPAGVNLPVGAWVTFRFTTGFWGNDERDWWQIGPVVQGG